MELSILLIYIGALVIGMVIGLLGGGGSILTVPLLVYGLEMDKVTATSYSLFVVGAAAGVGALRNLQKKNVDVRTAVVFAVPSLMAVFAVRKWLMPAIPEQLGSIGDTVITKDMSIMVLFALLMLMASYSMIRGRKDRGEQEQKAYNYPLIFVEGAVVGLLTGLVGAGGGFLIIPALVIMVGLPMKRAVGTSLLIITAKSLIGFLGDLGNVAMDWSFLLGFTGLAIAGILLGIYLTNFIEGKQLKKGFGYFVLCMALFIMWQELIQG